jgi:hypothetical protein
MNFAVGYHWFATALGWHIERALRSAGETVEYVGIGAPGHPGYASEQSLTTLAKDSIYLWIDPAGRYFPPDIEEARALTAGYLVDCHLGHWRESAARFFDVVFLAQKRYVEPYKRLLGHDQVYWLPLGAAADAHVDHGVERDLDVAFVGNIDRSHKATPRVRRLQLLAQRYRTNEFGRPATPEEVGHIYSRAKIVFNTSIAGDATMRLFEGTACGALMLTDPIAAQNGGDELFDGKEIATYRNDAELIERIDYFLAHPAERERVARAGQARTLRDHTYDARARTMLATLRRADVRRCAPMRSASNDERRHERLRVYTHLHMLDAVFDATRGLNPLRRTLLAAPCLARRILL